MTGNCWYRLEINEVESLKDKVNQIDFGAKLANCENFEAYAIGPGPDGNPVKIVHKWEGSDNRVRFLILFVILCLKVTHWLQIDFGKGILITKS